MTYLQKIFRKQLPASTLLETIVASVIFMIVFAMAMDTLTRLLSFDTGEADCVIIENDLRKCRREISQSELRPEKRTYQYEWGEINVEVSGYKDNIYQVDMVAVGNKKHRLIGYRFLQANP